MRTIVDLPGEQIGALKAVGERYHLSRAELVRRAVADYIENRKERLSEESGFGFWKARGEDGLAQQQRLREEWR